MAVVGFGRAALLYDVATRRPIADPLFAPSQYEVISSAAFTADGRQLVLTERRQQFHVLDASPDAWAARACRIANRNLTRDEWSRHAADQPVAVTCPAPVAVARR
jgi:hypothetical protein